jgi:hypothetical protein
MRSAERGKNMKRIILLGAFVCCGLGVAHATLVNYEWESDFANTGVVPDNDVNGWQDTRTITSFGGGGDWQITDLNVTLQLSGGFNGDLFGQLVHDSGFVVLLNHIGVTPGNPVGSLDSGLNVLFDQAAAADIHTAVAGGVLGGTYLPDSTYSPSTSLNSFNGLDPNGSWTLYLQDISFGGQSEVAAWGLQINAVPAPTTVGLGTFLLLAVGAGITRKYLKPV